MATTKKHEDEHTSLLKSTRAQLVEKIDALKENLAKATELSEELNLKYNTKCEEYKVLQQHIKAAETELKQAKADVEIYSLEADKQTSKYEIWKFIGIFFAIVTLLETICIFLF